MKARTIRELTMVVSLINTVGILSRGGETLQYHDSQYHDGLTGESKQLSLSTVQRLCLAETRGNREIVTNCQEEFRLCWVMLRTL